MELEVKKTTKYDIFRHLTANRDVKNTPVKKIIRSIEKVGAIPNPILVNEHMEVIDGQNRLEALKRMEQPVYYIVIPGLNVEHCRALNINQSNWTTRDYIASYAEDGNQHYIRFQKLCNRYSALGLSSIYCAVKGVFRIETTDIKNGDLECSENDYNNAVMALDYVMELYPAISKTKGRREITMACLMFCYWDENVDNRRMKDRYLDGYKTLSPAVTALQMLDELSDLYNSRLPSASRVYLRADYDKYLETRYKWNSIQKAMRESGAYGFGEEEEQ